ncbi:carboxypeptidase M32 [Sedimentibacter sp. zth1]|uniref:carboxypeptidase M32 n=1 Tax=Sedimentibacter sp. zth1 TaxID=2816908 RepID=UPI001A937AC4|nr:carboxypeptidase M32 [Sedimentibacter sp. zth1]QSX04754.1 carboxypeptidase M32 [Sedimentibacter sp. zth1]
MKELLKKYEELRKKIKAYGYAMWMIGWDSATEAPKGCFEERGKYLGILSEESYKFETSEEYTNVVNELFDNKDKLDEVLKHEIIEVKDGIDKIKKIPMNEYIEFQILTSNSQNIWVEAKTNSDFSIFKPCLEKIVMFMKKYTKYLETDKLKGYDVLLDQYEHGYTTKEYDEFFNLLKKELVPFVKKVTAKKLAYNDNFESKVYPKLDQKKFCDYIQQVMCYDTDRGLMKESEHPFTSGVSSRDVRFTNHYYENLLISSVFSAIHELGHATYEQQVNPEYDETFSGGGASMAMHESQSRFYENIIGRSKEFWINHFDKLKETFKEQFKDTTLEDFFMAINKVENSLIRTEADELTYPLHIMIRYDIEKMIFNNEIEVSDLPKVWNKMYKDYLGIDVPNDAVGVLQDMHWSDGSFGYFVTYALGSAYASQIYDKMKNDIDIEKALSTGTTKEINEWLKEKIHKYGATKYPKEILKIATGEDFNAMYYVNYLKDKYSKIYDI